MTNDNFETESGIFIIIGRVWPSKDEPAVPVHILLMAADDDSAVREALNALAEREYEEAEFDQIGTMVEAPDEEPHASAYQGALEGEVAIVTFAEGLGEEEPARKTLDPDEELDPFSVLKGWKPKLD